MPLALEIQRQVVHVLHQLHVHRALAELVESHVELPLALKRKAKHAIRFCRVSIGFLLATLADQKTLGRQQQVPDQQQGCGHHQLEPEQLRRHQHEVRADQCEQKATGNTGGNACLDTRQQTDQVGGDQQKHALLHPEAPAGSDKEMLRQQTRHGVSLEDHRRHARIDRRHEETAETCRRRPDQDDLVAVLVVRNLAALNIKERIDRECGATGFSIFVKEGQHPALGIGANAQTAKIH